MRKHLNHQDAKIIIVDDEPSNVMLLERTLQWANYRRIKGFTDSTAALEACEADIPDIILLDLHMPGMDGFEVLRRLKAGCLRDEGVPILVLTADVNAETKRKALTIGADDFLTKPYDATEVMLRVHNFLETRRLHQLLEIRNRELENIVQCRTRELSTARWEILERLAKAAEFRDDNTGEHAKRVGELSGRIAKASGGSESFVELIRMSAPLHDIGKIGIPDAILLKPARLDPEEFEVMKTHSIIGASILAGSDSPVLKMAEVIALSHHEKWDGSGYPSGLAGEEIPLPGRIVALADVYDALTTARPYKEAWSPEKAYDFIGQNSGTHFDPTLVRAFSTVVESERLPQAA